MEERVEYRSDHRDSYTHADTCTRSRVITYCLDPSSWINGTVHVEERVQYHSDHRDCYSASKHMHKE